MRAFLTEHANLITCIFLLFTISYFTDAANLRSKTLQSGRKLVHEDNVPLTSNSLAASIYDYDNIPSTTFASVEPNIGTDGYYGVDLTSTTTVGDPRMATDDNRSATSSISSPNTDLYRTTNTNYDDLPYSDPSLIYGPATTAIVSSAVGNIEEELLGHYTGNN